MDHHCPFISTCVGRRNYVYFWWFCVTLTLEALFMTTLTISDLRLRIAMEGSLRLAQRKVPFAVPLSILSSVTLILLSLLVGFHFYLNSTSQTTYEFAKKTYKDTLNPFTHNNILQNLRANIFVKKPKNPIFRPTELTTDGIIQMTRYTGPIYKTPKRELPPSVSYSAVQRSVHNTSEIAAEQV